MVCYESVVDVTLVLHSNFFLVMIGSNMIFYYFILIYKKLTSQQL